MSDFLYSRECETAQISVINLAIRPIKLIMEAVGVVTKEVSLRAVGMDLEDGMVTELNGVVKTDSEDVVGKLLERALITELTWGCGQCTIITTLCITCIMCIGIHAYSLC